MIEAGFSVRASTRSCSSGWPPTSRRGHGGSISEDGPTGRLLHVDDLFQICPCRSIEITETPASAVRVDGRSRSAKDPPGLLDWMHQGGRSHSIETIGGCRLGRWWAAPRGGLPVVTCHRSQPDVRRVPRYLRSAVTSRIFEQYDHKKSDGRREASHRGSSEWSGGHQ